MEEGGEKEEKKEKKEEGGKEISVREMQDMKRHTCMYFNCTSKLNTHGRSTNLRCAKVLSLP